MNLSTISRAIDFGPDVLLADPRVLRGELVEGGVDELAVRLRVLDLLELRHPLVVLHPPRLHLGDGEAAGTVELLPEDGVGVLEDRLDHREDVEGVGLAVRRDPRERVEEVQRERVEEREVALQPGGGADVRAAVAVDRAELDEAGAAQGAEPLGGGAAVLRADVVVAVGAADDLDEPAVAAAAPGWSRSGAGSRGAPKVGSNRLSSGSGSFSRSRSKVFRSQGT